MTNVIPAPYQDTFQFTVTARSIGKFPEYVKKEMLA
jgi:hypothetical protein